MIFDRTLFLHSSSIWIVMGFGDVAVCLGVDLVNHFMSLVSFYTHWKHLMFSGCIETDLRHEMSYSTHSTSSDLLISLHSDDACPILSANIPISFVITISYNSVTAVLTNFSFLVSRKTAFNPCHSDPWLKEKWM